MSNPPKRTPGAKPEQAQGFRGSYRGSTRAHPKRRVGNAERAPMIQSDMSLEVDLTGCWVQTHGECHVFINQAGTHIEVLIAVVENGAYGHAGIKPLDRLRSERRLISLGGDINVDGTAVDVYLHGEDLPIDDTSLRCGVIGWIDGGARLALLLDPAAVEGSYDEHKHARLARIATGTAERVSEHPVLLERHLLRPWVEHEVRTGYWFPLTEIQVMKLPRYIVEAKVRVAPNFLLVDEGGKKHSYAELICAFYQVYENKYQGEAKTTLVRAQWLTNIANALDRLVWQAYQNALNRSASKGGIDKFAVDFWRQASLRTLALEQAKPFANQPAQSLLEWTRRLLDGMPGVSFDEFADRLHVYAKQGGHDYDARIELVNLDGDTKAGKQKISKILKKHGLKTFEKVLDRITRKVPLDGTGGLIEIRKRAATQVPGAEVVYDWEGYYLIVLGGVGIAPGVGDASVTLSEGEARNVYGLAWQPEQLEGPVKYLDVGVGMYAGTKGATLSGTLIQCFGTGEGKPRHPLPISSWGDGKAMGGKGAGASFRRLAGWMVYLDSVERIMDIDVGPERQQFEYGVHTQTGPIHFPINGAMLEPEGVALLNLFTASELAALTRPGCELEIDGYADQPDDAIKNLILSRNRAITCYNWIKSILGDRGKYLLKLNDVPPEEEDMPSEKESREEIENWTIFDPSKGGVQIHARGEPSAKPGQGSEQYDSAFRRIELQMDGEVSLGLRRMKDGEVE